MSERTVFYKDPDAYLDYVWDWSEWLGDDTIVSHDVTVETGLTLESESTTTTAVTVWLSGGTLGETYAVTVKIDTAAGRTDERTSSMRIRNH